MKLRYRIWFEDDKGNYIFGEGTYYLLKNIEETKSLTNAVKKMSMSYRNGWGKIREVEERLGKKIVETRRGGKKVGETKLTDLGKSLMEEYSKYINIFEYYSKRPYIIPSLAVDGIIEEYGKVLLIKRRNEPFKGYYALPGGFVEYGERVEEAIKREIFEETGFEVEIKKLLGVYSSPDRDPRGHTVSIVYILEKVGGNGRAGDDAEKIEFFDIKKLPELAFDHNE
ncbi:MAG: NUDIX domain-containing protein, partial [Thermoplasmata archaeon]